MPKGMDAVIFTELSSDGYVWGEKSGVFGRWPVSLVGIPGADGADGINGIDGTTPTGVSFSANKNNINQTGIATATYTKITFTNEVWDTNGYYDAVNSKFTPLVAGKYLVVLAVGFSFNSANASRSSIYKNGAVIHEAFGSHSGDWVNPICTAIVSMNGTTDYIEAYAYHNVTGSQACWGSNSATYFQATLML